jgi:hypothetical protein
MFKHPAISLQPEKLQKYLKLFSVYRQNYNKIALLVSFYVSVDVTNCYQSYYQL